jgi:hypothetical protein
LVALVAVIVIAVVQRTTPPPAPVAPAPDLQGELLYVGRENVTRSRLWIWDLQTGEIRQGPSIVRPLTLVDANRAEPGEGWVGVTASSDQGEEASLLRNFSSNDFATPLLEGTLVAWSPGGVSVTSATKPGSGCSKLTIESRFVTVGAERTLFDDTVCVDLDALQRDQVTPHLGISGPSGPAVARLQNQHIVSYARDATLLAINERGDALVVPGCEGSPADAPGRACGGLTLVTGTGSSFPTFTRYGDRSDRALVPEGFLGWSRDGTRGFVLGSYGDVRGVYSVPALILQPTPPTLVLATLATNVYLTETYDRDLYLSRDGALLLIRSDGEEVPLRLPEGVPEPDGPILWLMAAGGAT